MKKGFRQEGDVPRSFPQRRQDDGDHVDPIEQVFAEAVLPDQLLCLYTDGIPETRNADGKPFGKTRLRQAIRENASASARTLLLSVLDAVGEFRGEPDQEDDLTLLMVKITPLE